MEIISFVKGVPKDGYLFPYTCYTIKKMIYIIHTFAGNLVFEIISGKQLFTVA